MPRTTKPNGNGKITPTEDFPLASYPPFQTLTTYQRNFLILYWLKPLKRWSNAYIYKRAFNAPGIKDSSAWVEASILLKQPKVTACLKRLDLARCARLDLSVDRIVEEETSIAFSDVGFLFDEDGLSPLSPAELPPEVRRAISGVEVKEKTVHLTSPEGEPMGTEVKRFYKYSLWNKGQALERLAKIKGIFAAEKHSHEVSGPDGKPLQANVTPGLDFSSLSTEDLKTLVEIASKAKPIEEEMP